MRTHMCLSCAAVSTARMTHTSVCLIATCKGDYDHATDNDSQILDPLVKVWVVLYRSSCAIVFAGVMLV